MRDRVPGNPLSELGAGELHSSVRALSVGERGALAQIRKRLGEQHTLTWSKLCETVPLQGPTTEQLELTAVERALAANAPHLREVCRRPYTKLETVLEPTAAARAKRVPPRAIRHLAEHSEQWERRTLKAVIPRRVLAQRFEDSFDVYENRVVARLIDGLLAYLRARTRELQDVAGLLKALDDFSLSMRGHHRLATRLGELWHTGLQIESAHDTLAQLTLLLRGTNDRMRGIGGLRSSPLYRGVPERARVSRRLRVTNVFKANEHYRHVARMWEVLDANTAASHSEAERERAERAAWSAFDAFALLLVVRALDRLAFQPDGRAELDLGQTTGVTLRGPRGHAQLDWEHPLGLTLSREGRALAQFVPVAEHLAGKGERSESIFTRADGLLRVLGQLDAAAPCVVALYPSIPAERKGRPTALAALLNPLDVGLGESRQCALLPISPYDLLSLERVERVVRRVVLADTLRAFPPRVSYRRIAHERVARLAPTWLAPDGSGEALLALEPLTAARIDELRALVRTQTKGLRPGRDDALRQALDALPGAVEREGGRYYEEAGLCPVCEKGHSASRVHM